MLLVMVFYHSLGKAIKTLCILGLLVTKLWCLLLLCMLLSSISLFLLTSLSSHPPLFVLLGIDSEALTS